MAGLMALPLRAYRRISALPVLRQDALLYLCAGVFAGGELNLSVGTDYREWAAVAIVPYLLAAAACEGIWQRRLRAARVASSGAATPTADLVPLNLDARDGSSVFRKATILTLLAACVLLPLALQVTWRAQAKPGPQAQPEVAVIERAGDRVGNLHDPYLTRPRTVGISPSSDARNVNADSFFPYLPGMVPFGLLNSTSAPPELADARVSLAFFTLLVVAIALLLAPAAKRRRWRAFQFIVVLPTGALPLVTGGDDLPVLALLLLGLVLVGRRRPVAAGLVLGVAGTLKLTAWPLLLLLALVTRDEDDRPAPLRYLLSVAAVVVPVVGVGVALGPHAFLENVVIFPLGLTKVHSPAASPMIGQELVTLLPGLKRELTVALLAIGVVAVATMFVRHIPRTAFAAVRFAGWALAFATVIAPATRFGYFIYPANMLVWAYLMREPPPGGGDEAPARATARSAVSSRRLPGTAEG